MENFEIEMAYKQYYNELYLYNLSLCKNHYLAEELVSETFLKAFVSLDKTNFNIKFWLFRVSKNLWIDYIKKNKRLAKKEIDENTIISDENILNKILMNERKIEIYEAILGLSSTYKEVIILYYFCDFSLNNIAKSLGITNGSARTLLYRARKKIEPIIKEEF